MEPPNPLNPQFVKWIGVVLVLDSIFLPMSMKPESNNALVSCPSTITLDSLASPTSHPNGSGL